MRFTAQNTEGVLLAAAEVSRLELVDLLTSIEWTPSKVWMPSENCKYSGPTVLEMLEERHKAIMEGDK